MTDLYMDLEWFPNQEIYLIGYGYSIGTVNLLYDDTLTMEHIIEMLKPVNGYIYFYGPDIGMLEKFTGLDIRSNYRCINLLKVFRDIMPGLPSYKLASFELMFDIKRTQKQYKTNIWQLNRDWYDPYKKQQVLKYNYEDVVNLIRLKRIVFSLYNISEQYLDMVLLQ